MLESNIKVYGIDYIINISEVSLIRDNNIINKDRLKTFCRSVLVILIDPDKKDKHSIDYFLQTFTINLDTTFNKLINSILGFWELNKREDEFSIKFIDQSGDISNVRNNSEAVDVFLKGRSNMKKAKFIFVSNKISINLLI